MLTFIVGWVMKIASSKLLGSVMGLLQKQSDNAVEGKKIDAQVAMEQIKAEMAARQNTAEVRLATAGFPEQRLLAFLAGVIPVLHFVLIGVGTFLVSPFDWDNGCKCYVNGTGWLEWTRHLPNLPAPWDGYEGPILLSFFGLVGAVSLGKMAVGAWTLVKRHEQ